MYNLYSRRQVDKQGNPEVFIYDTFPTPFRNQFFFIIRKVFEQVNKHSYRYDEFPELVCEMFAQEKGLKHILGNVAAIPNSVKALESYLDDCSNEDFLDFMDFIFGVFISNKNIQNHFNFFTEDNNFFQKAIDELNYRLKQNGLGYEFINGEIIVKTNTMTHENVVKPALKILSDEEFRGAEEEYLLAFENFRKGENKNAILNAVKAFESTMKIICSGLGYEYDKDRDTARSLINILEQNSFFPSYLNNHMDGLRKSLETGASTVRNKIAGHGQGVIVQDIEDMYVEYVLNLVATNIVFLYKIYRKKKMEEH